MRLSLIADVCRWLLSWSLEQTLLWKKKCRSNDSRSLQLVFIPLKNRSGKMHISKTFTLQHNTCTCTFLQPLLAKWDSTFIVEVLIRTTLLWYSTDLMKYKIKLLVCNWFIWLLLKYIHIPNILSINAYRKF